jgi:putative membrane protein
MKILTSLTLAALLGSASAALAASQADQSFMTKAIQGDMAEVQMGQLAQQKGGSDAVKSFGQMLVTDHQANQQQAEQLAKQIGVTPPNAPSAEQKADHDRLAKLSGAEFDRHFAKMMVEDHRKDISEFRHESKNTKDPVGQYASQTVPTLEKHLHAAEQLDHNRAASR